MTVEAIAYINEVLIDAGINYEYGMWTQNPIPSPFFVGENIDIEPVNEDGMTQSTFILTGTGTGTWLELIDKKELIESLFPSVGGRVARLENGSSVAIFFGTAQTIPSDTIDIKRIQINLTVKEWKVN